MDLWNDWTSERVGTDSSDGVEVRNTPAVEDPATAGTRRAEPSEDASGRGALDAFMSGLHHFPVLPQSEVNRLVREIREEETRFRELIVEVPGAAVFVLERWQERKAHRRVTGLLSHRFRDEPDQDWTAFIDERLGILSGLVARRGRLTETAPESRRRSLDRKITSTLASAEIRFETLQEITHELRGLLHAGRGRSVEARRRELGLTARPIREILAEAERALDRRHSLRQKVAAHNLRLVVHVSKRYRSQDVPFVDLIQEGSIGLLRAIDKFDPDLGYRFATYAVWWIEQAAIRAIQRDSRTVRVPSHVYDHQMKYKAAHQSLLARKGAPSRDDLVAALDIPEDRVDLVASTLLRTRSLDTPLDEEEGATHGDRLRDPSEVDPSAGLELDRMRLGIDRALSHLTPREREVVRSRFGLEGEEELTLQQVGERIGLSRERVRQIEKRALAKLGSERSISDLKSIVDSEDLAAAS